ncbi:MAG: hypothetical protein EXR86_14350 [Gammaproteobacteria bacterium]|nr:hypothetical protein [Gammaproteobacteria bacterium]
MPRWSGLRAQLLATLALMLAGCAESNRTIVFDTVAAPRGDYTLVALVITPWFPQGPHQVALDLIQTADGGTERLIKTSLAYDGVPFTKQNIGLRWTADHSALVCLRATDRPDQGVQITVETGQPTKVQHRHRC